MVVKAKNILWLRADSSEQEADGGGDEVWIICGCDSQAHRAVSLQHDERRSSRWRSNRWRSRAHRQDTQGSRVNDCDILSIILLLSSLKDDS